jgi:hypothetical protein
VSILGKGDGPLHYSDTSHRWIAPPEIEQRAWEAKLRAHLDLHLTTRGSVRDPTRLPHPRGPADQSRRTE